MPVELGSQGVGNASDVTSGDRPAKGKYLVVLEDFEEKISERTQEAFCHFEWKVIGGTVPGQEDKVLPVNIGTTEKKDLGKLQRIAMTLGLLPPHSPPIAIDFNEGIGRMIVIEVDEFQPDDGEKMQVVGQYGYGYWAPTDPAVQDVPKPAEAMAYHMQMVQATGQTPAVGQPPMQQPPMQQPPMQQQPMQQPPMQQQPMQQQPMQQQPQPTAPQQPAPQQPAPQQPAQYQPAQQQPAGPPPAGQPNWANVKL